MVASCSCCTLCAVQRRAHPGRVSWACADAWRHYLYLTRISDHWTLLMEVPTSEIEVSHSSESEGLEETSREGSARNEREHEVEEQSDPANEPSLAPATRSVALEQSTLTSYRTPVLPNLAQAALERLQKRNLEDSESQNSDFQPLKKRKMEEHCQSEEENEVGVSFHFCPLSQTDARSQNLNVFSLCRVKPVQYVLSHGRTQATTGFPLSSVDISLD